jgi:hypothetical protein
MVAAGSAETHSPRMKLLGGFYLYAGDAMASFVQWIETTLSAEGAR